MRFRRNVLVIGAMVLWAGMLNVTSTSATAGNSEDQHCVGRLVPLGPPDSDGVIDAEGVTIGCYQTFTQAMSVATNGGLKLSPRSTPANLTQSMLERARVIEPEAVFVLSNEYNLNNFGGTSWTWTASSGCSGSSSWTLANVGAAQNDRYNSAKGFSGCQKVVHYWDANFGQPTFQCTPNCSTMGSMNNQTTSLKWHAS